MSYPIPIPSYRRATAHAGYTQDTTHTQALLALAQKATAPTEEAIPDGLVPARLPPLLRAMGVAGCDVRATVVNLIGVQCKGAANLERTAAHRDAVHLHEIGVHLDGVHRHTTETVQCHLCGAASTRLQRVRAGARGSQSTRLVAEVRAQHVAAAATKLRGKAAKHTRSILTRLYSNEGALLCFACALPALAEEASAPPKCRTHNDRQHQQCVGVWQRRRLAVEGRKALVLPWVEAGAAKARRHRHTHTGRSQRPCRDASSTTRAD